MTRLAGLFGNASVGYKIRGAMGEERELLGEQAEGRIFFMENRTVATLTVPISNQVPGGQRVGTLPQELTMLLICRCLCLWGTPSPYDWLMSGSSVPSWARPLASSKQTLLRRLFLKRQRTQR